MSTIIIMCRRVPRLCWILQRIILTPVSSTEQPEDIKATPGGEEMSLISYMPQATTGKSILTRYIIISQHSSDDFATTDLVVK